MNKQKVILSFDIGHSSIGWSVLGPSRPDPEILGCGSVIFPNDDCLASQRRLHRRTRRNIRATRQRIARMKRLLLHLGVLDEKALDASGHPAPHVLAARVLLSAQAQLTWEELWHVLRWYAHNRGYDGNARWAKFEMDDEDTQKELTARRLMQEHGTATMAETVCAVLGIQPLGTKISSDKPFKTNNAAFPRRVVRDEVLAILRRHLGVLPGLDETVIECLIQQGESSSGWRAVSVPGVTLPKRYQGGLLFGQLVPRFDNRIIGVCPISGEKVPEKSSREFLEYRWAMLLANIKVEGRFLSADERREVNALMKEKGRLTPTELREFVVQITGCVDNNIKASFEIHPDSKDALVLDPVTAFCEKAAQPPGKKPIFEIARFWPHLPEVVQKRASGRWRKGRLVNLNWMLDQLEREGVSPDALREAIEFLWRADQEGKKPRFLAREHLLQRAFQPEFPSGRAPYSRRVMKQVVEFVLSTDCHPMEEGGPVYRSPKVLRQERGRSISELTNNHLIRQRLDILMRLTRDIITNYAGGDESNIKDIVVEVARDLQEYSGLTAKEMAGELTKRLSHFKAAVKYLEDHAPDLQITGSLIRKCRIAMDLDWKCPFTGRKYDPYSLEKMEREHIIPYADRPTNALDAQVLTFDWVNREKGKRTAMQFILEMAGDDRFFTPGNYRKFVEALTVARRETYPDDFRRQSLRKKWLLLEKYDAKDQSFTLGALTQTSHLNRLAHRQIEKLFADPQTGDCSVRIHAIPGQVTAEARKAWNLLGTLVPACPECQGKTKTEIREITHLHHALDAATLGLIHHYLPGRLPGQSENEKGLLWKAMLRRNKTPGEVGLLLQTGVFKRREHRDIQGASHPDATLCDLPDAVKQNLANRLREIRVVQHIPADQSGGVLEQNPWRVWKIHDNPEDSATFVTIRQRTSSLENGVRKYEKKEEIVRATKLVGLRPGKLKKNMSVLQISENYGLALEPTPMIIPFHSVSERLRKVRRASSRRDISILRKGMLIRILKNPPQNQQDYTGIWRIESCKDNKSGPALDIVRPAYIKPVNKVTWAGMNKNIEPFVKAGLEILRPALTGLNPSDLT